MCSWLFGIFYIQRKYSIIKINFRHLEFDRDLFRQALRLGVPSGIQQMCFSIGIMVMQALVNGYGSIFMAGFNGANKIDSFAFMPVQSYSIAVTTYTGQNIGAKLFDRVKKGTNAALVLAVVTCIIIGGILYPFSSQLMRMFSSDPGVLESGVWYLHSVLPFYILLGASFIYSSTLKGAGRNDDPIDFFNYRIVGCPCPSSISVGPFLRKGVYIFFLCHRMVIWIYHSICRLSAGEMEGQGCDSLN